MDLRSSCADVSPTSFESTSRAGRAFSNQPSSASGLSESVNSGFGLRGMTVSFSLVGSSQADHMNHATPWCEDQHMQVFSDPPQGLKSIFRIVLALILRNQSAVPFKIHYPGKIKPPQQQIALRFAGMEGIMIQLLYPQDIRDLFGMTKSKSVADQSAKVKLNQCALITSLKDKYTATWSPTFSKMSRYSGQGCKPHHCSAGPSPRVPHSTPNSDDHATCPIQRRDVPLTQ